MDVKLLCNSEVSHECTGLLFVQIELDFIFSLYCVLQEKTLIISLIIWPRYFLNDYNTYLGASQLTKLPEAQMLSGFKKLFLNFFLGGKKSPKAKQTKTFISSRVCHRKQEKLTSICWSLSQRMGTQGPIIRWQFYGRIDLINLFKEILGKLLLTETELIGLKETC